MEDSEWQGKRTTEGWRKMHQEVERIHLRGREKKRVNTHLHNAGRAGMSRERK